MKLPTSAPPTAGPKGPRDRERERERESRDIEPGRQRVGKELLHGRIRNERENEIQSAAHTCDQATHTQKNVVMYVDYVV